MSSNTLDTSDSKNKHLTNDALIFYADDEEVNRELVTGELKQAGYQVEVFGDGQALLDKLPTKLAGTHIA